MKKQSFTSDVLGESYTLAEHESGLKIYIMEKPQYESAYALFGTKYGSIDTRFRTPDGQVIEVPNGIAHFLEHKLFESEEGDAFTRYAETGGYANAFTSFDRTCYLFSCSDRFSDNLDILLDFVQSPYFTAETVQKEQGIIGQEIRMYDDSGPWRVLFNLLQAMYVNHPVRIDIAGTVESIAQIDDKLLYQCYQTFYNPANMFLCIAGKVDTDDVLKQISAGLKPVKSVTVERCDEDEPVTVLESYTEQALEVGLPLFCFGYKEQCAMPERTLKEKICTEMLLEILAGDASPLYASLLKDGLINDAFDTEYFTGRGYAATLFEGESKDPRAVAYRIKKEVARLKSDGIDPKLFAVVQRSMYGAAIKRFDNVEQIAMGLTECAMFGEGLFDEMKILRSVTPNDVFNRLKYWDDANSVLSVITPKKEGAACTK